MISNLYITQLSTLTYIALVSSALAFSAYALVAIAAFQKQQNDMPMLQFAANYAKQV